MKSFRDIRVIPVVLVAIFGLAVLKVAGLVIDGGYVFDYQPQRTSEPPPTSPPQPTGMSSAQDTFNFLRGGTRIAAKPDLEDITGSTHGAPKEPPKPGGTPTADPPQPARRQ